MFDNNTNKEDVAREFIDSIKKSEETDVEKMHQALAQAKHEWEFAQSYFDSVSEPDLVEFAIFNQKAAEQKYEYLLKQAKELKLIK